MFEIIYFKYSFYCLTCKLEKTEDWGWACRDLKNYQNGHVKL